VNVTFLYADYDKVGNRKSCKIDDADTATNTVFALKIGI
jgi:hypothetical protein